MREFPGDLLPGLNRPLATTIPVPAITTRAPVLRGLTSGANEQQKRKIQSTKALIKPLAAVDKDIEMAVGDSRDNEPPGRSQRKAAQKRKAVTDVRGKTGGEDTSGVDDTDSSDELNLASNRKGLPPKSRTTLTGEGKAVAKNTGEVELVSTKASGGRKHFMQVSHIEIPSKRAKVTGVVDERSDEDEEGEEDGGEEVEEQVAPEPRHLQGLSFEKGSAVDLEIMVPALIGRVCFSPFIPILRDKSPDLSLALQVLQDGEANASVHSSLGNPPWEPSDFLLCLCSGPPTLFVY